MAFGLTIGTERATTLQNSIQDELLKRGFSPDADPVMAEYITIMIINNKTQAQISSELEDLIGSDFDATFVDWLFLEAAKGAPESEAPVSPAEPSTSQPSARESPPHITQEAQRRPPNGPRSGVPLYQQAISAALPSPSPTAQKRTASARSPSPTGHANKSRRTDLPTGPRAMLSRDGPGGSAPNRSLLERMGPRNGHGPYPPDDIQARIDTITNASPEQQMMMMQAGGFPMGGMDMSGMAGINPFALQEMLMANMAMMSQFAGAMGVMMPPGGGQMMNGGFPGMGQDMGMFNGGMNGMQHGEGAGRGRLRGGRGGPGQRGRSRGGHTGLNGPSENASEQPAAPTPATPAVVAPTPTPAASMSSVVQPVVPTTSAQGQAQTRPGFVPPERPQSPTLCKYALKCTNPTCRYSHPSPVATAESGVVLSNDPCEKGKDCKDRDCIKAHVSPAVLNPNAAEHFKPNTFVAPPQAAAHAHPQTACRYGSACTRQGNGCPYFHPTPRPEHKAPSAVPCRFGAACTRASCVFQHPEGRVLPSTFHRGLSTSAPLVSVQTPETGSMGGPSPHRSITFNKTGSAAQLEKKLKDMELKKSEAEKAVAQAEKAAATATATATGGKKDDPSKPVSIAV
ncbi:hypothetical protein B0H21DRAFT_745748 [Amylocystis lapponica]|nr:hypothetical protein B0H21DRAFT_745748 [Amylocystis lapponica]